MSASDRGVEQRRGWGSGAAVAVVAAATGLTAHLALRATSEGSLGRPVLLAGAVLLALVLWPLAARTTSIGTLTLVLATAQFGTHALAVVAAGQAADARSLVCCPSSQQVRPGMLGALTADAGWVLASAQLAACFLLALAVRGGREAADLLTAAAHLVRAAVDSAGGRLVALLALALRAIVTVPALPTPRPAPARVLDAGRVAARRTTRRGPPAPAFPPVPSRAVPVPLVLPAAG